MTEAYANILYPTPARESGVDEIVRYKFPGAHVIDGSSASGAGDNREIPLEEGGDINPKMVRENVRQGQKTIRPAGSMGNNLKQ